MMAKKKVLGIVGSPRRNGNTHVLVSRILQGARAAGAKTETIFLADLDIGECDGCCACWKGKHECVKDDDMSALYPKIIEADALVLGTPVYWFGPTAILKGFIDRLFLFCGPARSGALKGKPVAVAMPFADRTDETAGPAVALFAKTFEFLGMRWVGRILVPSVAKRGEVRAKEKAMKKCLDLGRRLAG